MTDFLEEARRQIAIEDATLLNQRIEARAKQLHDAAAARQAAASELPRDRAGAEAKLAQYKARRAELLDRQRRAWKNPALTMSADHDAECDRLRGLIDTLEGYLAAFPARAAA